MSGLVRVSDGTGKTSDQPKYNLTTEILKSNGSYGYAESNADYLGGVFSGRTAANVWNPGTPTAKVDMIAHASSDSRIGSLRVVSDTLPSGTPVSITVCASVTVDLAPVETSTPSSSANRELLCSFNFGTLEGYGMATRTNSDFIFGTGIFFGETASIFTKTFSTTFAGTVGGYIRYDAFFDLYARSPFAPPSSSLRTASSAYAATFGLQSITAGASLQWNGTPWTGSCEDSRQFLPPVPPVPSASALGLLASAGALAVRRRARTTPVHA